MHFDPINYTAFMIRFTHTAFQTTSETSTGPMSKEHPQDTLHCKSSHKTFVSDIQYSFQRSGLANPSVKDSSACEPILSASPQSVADPLNALRYIKDPIQES